jgi:VanZ family protein
MKLLLLKYLPVLSLVLVLITIAILSLLPPESGLELKKDKMGHLIAYLTLSANAQFFSRNKADMVIILLFVCAYGGLLEILQGLVPGRQPSNWDMLANCSGAMLGLILHLIISKKLKKLFLP